MDETSVMNELESRMNKTIEALKTEFGKIRGGRASVKLLDSIRVDYYGTSTPLNQMATLSTPEPRLISISPWDKSAVPMIEKAIMTADLGLTPANDGTTIRLNVPALTEERRRDLVKVIKRTAEDARVSLRNIRRDSNDHIKADAKDKDITEDDEKRLLKKVQEMTDKFIHTVEELTEKKEKDIMEV